MNTESTSEILDMLITESSAILSVDPAKVNVDAPLAELGFNSLRFVELLVAVELHLQIKLIDLGMQPEDVRTLRTLACRINRAGLKP